MSESNIWFILLVSDKNYIEYQINIIFSYYLFILIIYIHDYIQYIYYIIYYITYIYIYHMMFLLGEEYHSLTASWNIGSHPSDSEVCQHQIMWPGKHTKTSGESMGKQEKPTNMISTHSGQKPHLYWFTGGCTLWLCQT